MHCGGGGIGGEEQQDGHCDVGMEEDARRGSRAGKGL